MKQAILDTNFIMTCLKQKIDFFEELRFMGFQILIPKQVIAELERMSKTKKGSAKEYSELALNFLRINRPRIIDLKTKGVDKGLIKYSKKNPAVAIATLDREVKAKSHHKIVIREKKRLESI